MVHKLPTRIGELYANMTPEQLEQTKKKSPASDCARLTTAEQRKDFLFDLLLMENRYLEILPQLQGFLNQQILFYQAVLVFSAHMYAPTLRKISGTGNRQIFSLLLNNETYVAT